MKKLLLLLMIPALLYGGDTIFWGDGSSGEIYSGMADPAPTVDNITYTSRYDFNQWNRSGNIVNDIVGSNNLTCLFVGDSTWFTNAPGGGQGFKTDYAYNYDIAPCSTSVTGFQPDTGFIFIDFIMQDNTYGLYQAIVRFEDNARENRIVLGIPANVTDTLNFNIEGNDLNKQANFKTSASDGDTVNCIIFYYFDGDSLIGGVFYNGVYQANSRIKTEQFDGNLTAYILCSSHGAVSEFKGIIYNTGFGSFEGNSLSIAQCSTACIDLANDCKAKRLSVLRNDNDTLFIGDGN